MKYQDTFQLIKNLKFDTEQTIAEVEGVRLYVLRPSTLSKRFKTYDIKKNFQIWLQIGDRKFRPNHLRVMIDLHLRSRSRHDLKRTLLEVFDNIFYGADPGEEIKKIETEKFEHFLNPLRIIANLSQLFLVEQDYAYYKESQFDPPTLFYQGWLRQAVDDTREIDNMCMSIASRQPPPTKYTSLENKKNNKYSARFRPLWYLEK